MRDRLIELLRKPVVEQHMSSKMNWEQFVDATYGSIADNLLANGVVVLDMGVVSPKNRPLITHIAGMPLDEAANLINRQKAEIDCLLKRLRSANDHIEELNERLKEIEWMYEGLCK